CSAAGRRHRRRRSPVRSTTHRPSMAGSSTSSIAPGPCSRGSGGAIPHRPGSVRTEIRVGHPALPRRHPEFHAVSVMSAILGGLFNSRLNMNLREEKGYTYGASAGFDMRRGRGPFGARAAVNTEVTMPALAEMLGELERIREAPVDASE